MPAYRRSISVPPRSKFPSTFDHPSLNSSQPATPVYGRHTGLEGYVPEGFLHTPQSRERISKRTHSEELVQGLEKVQMGGKGTVKDGRRSSQDASLKFETISSPSPSTSRPVLSPFPAFSLDPSLSLTPPPVVKPFPPISDFPLYSPCPPPVSPQFQLYDVNPSNPQALPLPSPPQEGEYVFPDSSGRASLLNAHPTFPQATLQGHFDSDALQPLPILQAPLSTSPSTRENSHQASRSWLPPSPKLEPMRDLYPSPPSGRLSAFSPSPLNPSSPAFELEGPLFGGWSPVKTGNGGGLHAQLQHHGVLGGARTRGLGSSNRNSGKSPSPLRGNGTRAKERELEKAKERIRELESEVAILRQAFIDQAGQRENLTPS